MRYSLVHSFQINIRLFIFTSSLIKLTIAILGISKPTFSYAENSFCIKTQHIITKQLVIHDIRKKFLTIVGVSRNSAKYIVYIKWFWQINVSTRLNCDFLYIQFCRHANDQYFI